MKRVVVVAGTRPEAIKVAPVVRELAEDADMDVRVLATGQHQEILDQVLGAFSIVPDAKLDLMRPGQSLACLTGRALAEIASYLERTKPDMLVVQGDTTTAFSAGLAAFYAGIPVAHVEAGLRTGDMSQPFPEEANRRLLATLASLHLAPTSWARANLLAEGVDPERIVVTGNTVVDALEAFLRAPWQPRTPGLADALDAARGRRLVVVTTHRRENWGEPQRRIARALRATAARFPGAFLLVPMHPNPVVRDVLSGELAGIQNVALTEPLDYAEMVHTLSRAWVAVSDSGGIQEEGSALGVPVLVLRDVTERPEGVEAGVLRLVGTDEARIRAALQDVLGSPGSRDAMARAAGVFGDGLASRRIRSSIRRALGIESEEIEEFVPTVSDQKEVPEWAA